MALQTAEATPGDFKKAMSSFASGVNVVTVYDDGGLPYGMTLTAFCSVSVEPMQVLVCVFRGTKTFQLIDEQGRFGVNMLPAEARTISEYCARPGTHKTLKTEWLAERTGNTPVLSDALVHVDCRVATRLDAGTHRVFIGAVPRIGLNDDAMPLMYYRGKYTELAVPTLGLDALYEAHIL